MPKNTHRRPKRLVLSLPRLTALTFVLAFAAVGSLLLLISHAANAPVELQMAFNRGLCMDNYNSSTASKNSIDIWGCNGTYAQEWTVQDVSGGFLLVDGQGTCADDTNDAVGTSATDRVYLQTYPCNASDHAQVWEWNGSNPAQIQNVYNDGCINDPGNSTSNGQQLIIYPCSPASNNAQWYLVNEAPPNPSVSVTSPASGATVGGSGVLVAGSASIPSGSIADITLKAAGNTIGSCANAGTCFASWNTTSLGNGSYTVQVTATGSGGGSASASISVTVSNSSAAPPSSGGSGGGSSGGGAGSGSSGGGGGSSSSGSGLGTGVGSLSFDDSGSSGDSLSISPDTSDDTGDSDLGISQSPDDTLDSSGESGAVGPTVYDILAGKITAGSITLTWQTANANAYVVQYGTNQDSLTGKVTVKSAAATPLLNLTGLPSNSKIYVAITPKENGSAGATVSTSFQTLKASNPVGSIIGWTLFLLIAVVGILLLRRRFAAVRSSSGSVSPMVDIENIPAYPQEDSATQADRLNWWMSDEQRQAAAQQQVQPHRNAADDIPDMYDEGRKRLEDEQNHNQLPGA